MSGPTDLGAFLRARREALRPTDVGLVDHGRRRTPGLRREEVAALAGVSIDYLTRLEQGRDVNPSTSVIAALAAALQLDDKERTHLARLAAITNSRELCPEATPLATNVGAGVRHLLDSLDAPAFVVGPIGDVIAWNDQWARVVGGFGLLDDVPPNLARFAFTHPRARSVYRDWEAAAAEQVARLRAAEPRWGDDAAFRVLLDDLLTLDEFRARWSTHPVGEKQRGTKRLEHPEAGALAIAYEVLLLADDDQRLVTWRAADDITAPRLAALVDEHRPQTPARLSVVVNR
ncbi:MAG TPA: helix-turn-helix transcriptional regulator [Acidimicrobiia bacterium]|nr:helix-turn-helix transcriptional regulator [Acidimicrobiia bacterium]